MPTPLTVTASAWRYCNLSCSYCVSRSNQPKWRPRKSFEIFTPPGDERLNALQLDAKWGHGWFERMCPDKNRYLNPNDVLNFDYLRKWLAKHARGCQVHIAGGEPLLRPDIEEQIEKLCFDGIPVTILTNGTLIERRPALAALPAKWIVTHHRGAEFTAWRRNVEMIRHRPYMVCRVITSENEEKDRHQIEKQYRGLNFFWQKMNSTRIIPWPGYADADLPHIASGVIHLIEADGRIFACNRSNRAPIGHILNDSYDHEMAKKHDRKAISCVMGGICGAYQTAYMAYRL